jgi:hypothetical protein
MNKKILIILFLAAICFYYCYPKIEKFSQNMRLTNLYGASSSRVKHGNYNDPDEVYQIGIDSDNNCIYKFKEKHFKLKDDFNFESYDPKKIKYLPVAVKIPVVITSKSIKSKVPMTFKKYRFKGLVANEFYKQYYILYEKEYKNFNMDDKLYRYILAKKNSDGNYVTIHEIPPRSKIEIGDSIYFSYGNFQLGPLKFV